MEPVTKNKLTLSAKQVDTMSFCLLDASRLIYEVSNNLPREQANLLYKAICLMDRAVSPLLKVK